MDSDDDYMSEKILQECTDKDVRPGLLHNRKLIREHILYKKKNASKIRSFKELAEEKREEGLNTAIPETNKGYRLLSKMGYTPNSGIGKSVTGDSAPITIKVKSDNSGLGLSNVIKERLTSKVDECSAEEYRDIMIRKNEIIDMKRDYSKLQHSCYNIDKKNEINKPVQKWYWPDNTISSDSSDSESDSNTETSQLEVRSQLKDRIDSISCYLREKYYYCIWCAIQYTDQNDLKSCPGKTKEHHEDNKCRQQSDFDSD